MTKFLKNLWVFAVVVNVITFAGLGCAHAPLGGASHTEASAEIDPGVMTDVHQFTYSGPRAGEAYFNRDGTKIIFQSEREPNNPFYQIYTMDLVSGEINRMSPGKGKTTCSWFAPDDKHVLFSSTHEDPDLSRKVKEELEQRKAATKSKYSWSFDDQFKIYERNLATGKLKVLTPEHGYNAEGSYSPDGQLIAFASNRKGYSENLSPEDKKMFTQDPSYMMDIFIMNSDGTNVRQLTNTPGYDGGPFFSPDGKKITWRRFTPNGQSAEVYTMNIDGTGQKAITHLNAMSWAPFYHPSGDYLIFTTNKQGFANFELYIVDAEGKHEPVRVSYIPDFDGLPVFHPNGREILWTHRNEKGESQLYRAAWDDAKARGLLGLRPAQKKIRLGQFAQISNRTVSADSIQQTINYLADSQFDGRQTASAETARLASELGTLFQQFGLEPVEGASFLNEFPFTAKVELGSGVKATFEDTKHKTSHDLVVEKDFAPSSFSKTGTFGEAPVAFAGYGIVAPASEKFEYFDSYKNVDVKGKWALILRDVPEDLPVDQKVHMQYFSRIQSKALTAAQKGAVGVLVIGSGTPNLKVHFEGAAAALQIPVLNLSSSVAEELLKDSGRTLAQWTAVLDKGEPQGVELKSINFAANVDFKWTSATGVNVVGQLRVPGAVESVVVGAHLDHLGHGEFGSSLAKNGEQGAIHPGADDNASGVAGVLALARELTAEYRSGLIKPKRNIIFALWSGEELGLLGSTYWVKHAKQKIVANINMDMIGRYRSKLLVQGVGSAPEWKTLFEHLALESHLGLVLQDDPYLPSDSMAFYLQGIPTVMFFTGAHPEYHSPRDTANLINASGEVEVLEVVRQTIDAVAIPKANEKPMRLTYIKAESSRSPLEGRAFRVYLGTIPDYTQEGIKGVKISGTTKNSPAEQAGLLADDVIVELSGMKIENLYDYQYTLQSLKPQKTTKIVVLRKGESHEMPITPGTKE